MSLTAQHMDVGGSLLMDFCYMDALNEKAFTHKSVKKTKDYFGLKSYSVLIKLDFKHL